MKLLLPGVIALFVLAALIAIFSRPSIPVASVIPDQASPAPINIAKLPAAPDAPAQPPAQSVLIDGVPFTVQAPFAEWSDPRQQDACEEASVIMAVRWAKGETIASKQAAKDEILAIVQYEIDKYNGDTDTSAQDTLDRVIVGFYHFPNAKVLPINSTSDLIDQLRLGNLIIVPANGQALGNPNFTQPGPQRHMLVIKGFDLKTSVFITNDPGVRQGENYRYSMTTLFNAIRDYPTGHHVPITTTEKRMIVVSK